MQFKVKEVKELKKVVLAIKEKIPASALIILQGELGAGKTTFVRTFCEVLEVTDQVSSPTYVLEHQYQGKNLLIEHWDLYRVNEVPEDLYEIPQENTIRFVEWGNKFNELESIADLIINIKLEEENGDILRIVKVNFLEQK